MNIKRWLDIIIHSICLLLIVPVLLKLVFILIVSYFIVWIVELVIRRPIPEKVFYPLTYPINLLFKAVCWLLARLVGKKPIQLTSES